MRNAYVFTATAIFLILGVKLDAVPAPASQSPLIPPSLGVCPSPMAQSASRVYEVGARVRVLLFWTGLHDEGRARIAWSSSADGTRRTELLIGTDPDLAFRRLNRWGYISETTCEAGAEIVGLMTAADEASIEEAQARLDSTGVGASMYRAIRTRIANHTATADVLRLSTSETFTFRDASALFARLPASGALRHLSVPTDAEPGLLAATSHLIALATTEAARSPRRLSHARRRYVYAATTYELVLASSTIRREVAIGSARYGPALDAAFTILNLSTGETTEFALTAGTIGDLAGVPLRIVYRPRWWLELELTLTA